MEIEDKTTEYWVDNPAEWLKAMNKVTGGYTVICLSCGEMCMNEFRWSKEDLHRFVDTAATGELNDFSFAPGSIGWIIKHHDHNLRIASIEELYKEAQASK